MDMVSLPASEESYYSDISDASTVFDNINHLYVVDREHLKILCTDFINHSDTVIAMEHFWTDHLVKEIYVNMKKEQIMQALAVSEDRFEITVIQYGGPYANRWWNTLFGDRDWNVGVRIYDYKLYISTHDWLI